MAASRGARCDTLPRMRWASLPSRARALLFFAVLGATWLGPSSRAGAQPKAGRPSSEAARDLASDAYNRGAAAHERGDHATAAREFAQADAIAPDPVTLRVALDAAVLADDPVLGGELVERAAQRPADAQLAEAVRAARERFAGRTGRVRVICPADEGAHEPPRESACTATLDGQSIDAGRPVIARVGRHIVTTRRDGRAEQWAVEVKPDEVAEVVFAAPGPAAPPVDTRGVSSPAEPGGGYLSPAWFFVGLGATAIAGGFAIALGVDTAGRHQDFLDAGCAGSAHGDCSALADDGISAQHRANALLGVTAALGAATIAMGILSFAVRGDDRAVVSLGARGGGPVAALRVPLP